MHEVVFEVQATQELWRMPGATFTVMYPTHQIASVMGLRGTMSRAAYIGLNNVLYPLGYRTIIFEREVNGKLEYQERALEPPRDYVKATTVVRRE